MSELIRYNDKKIESPFVNSERFKGLRSNEIIQKPIKELDEKDVQHYVNRIFIHRN